VAIDNSNMVSNANAVIGAFNYARIEAIKRGGAVSVGQVGADWTEGIIVSDGAEDLRQWPSFDDVVTVSSAQATFSFSGTGEVNNAGVLDVCDNRTGEEGMRVSILLSGVIISEKVTCD
jgi:type IV fimbrial biogenesis protein FimT